MNPTAAPSDKTGIPPQFTKWEECWLRENDAFGTLCPVMIRRVCKNGTVKLWDRVAERERVNHVRNLRKKSP